MTLQQQIDSIQARRSELGPAGIEREFAALAASHGLAVVTTQVAAAYAGEGQGIERPVRQCAPRPGCVLLQSFIDKDGELQCVYRCTATLGKGSESQGGRS